MPFGWGFIRWDVIFFPLGAFFNGAAFVAVFFDLFSCLFLGKLQSGIDPSKINFDSPQAKPTLKNRNSRVSKSKELSFCSCHEKAKCVLGSSARRLFEL